MKTNCVDAFWNELSALSPSARRHRLARGIVDPSTLLKHDEQRASYSRRAQERAREYRETKTRLARMSPEQRAAYSQSARKHAREHMTRLSRRSPEQRAAHSRRVHKRALRRRELPNFVPAPTITLRFRDVQQVVDTMKSLVAAASVARARPRGMLRDRQQMVDTM